MGFGARELIGPYSKSIKQQQLGGAIIKNNVSLTCMKMIDPTKGWFEISLIPTYDLDVVTVGNYEHIDKSSAGVIQLFNNTWISRYPRPHKFMFDNGSECKYETLLLC